MFQSPHHNNQAATAGVGDSMQLYQHEYEQQQMPLYNQQHYHQQQHQPPTSLSRVYSDSGGGGLLPPSSSLYKDVDDQQGIFHRPSTVVAMSTSEGGGVGGNSSSYNDRPQHKHFMGGQDASRVRVSTGFIPVSSQYDDASCDNIMSKNPMHMQDVNQFTIGSMEKKKQSGGNMLHNYYHPQHHHQYESMPPSLSPCPPTFDSMDKNANQFHHHNAQHQQQEQRNSNATLMGNHDNQQNFSHNSNTLSVGMQQPNNTNNPITILPTQRTQSFVGIAGGGVGSSRHRSNSSSSQKNPTFGMSNCSSSPKSSSSCLTSNVALVNNSHQHQHNMSFNQQQKQQPQYNTCVDNRKVVDMKEKSNSNVTFKQQQPQVEYNNNMLMFQQQHVEKIKKPRKTIKRKYQFKNGKQDTHAHAGTTSPSSPASDERQNSNESKSNGNCIETVSYYTVTDGKELDLTRYYQHQLQYTSFDLYSNASISIVRVNPTYDVRNFKRSVDSISKHELLRVLHLTQQQASTILGCSVSTIKRRFYGLRNELGLTKWPNNYFEYSHMKLFNDIYPLSLNFILNKDA